MGIKSKQLPVKLTKKATVHFDSMSLIENANDKTVIQFINHGELVAEIIYTVNGLGTLYAVIDMCCRKQYAQCCCAGNN